MTQIEIDGEWLEQCDNCGNIWDGYAQCNCWQMKWYDDEAAQEEAQESAEESAAEESAAEESAAQEEAEESVYEI